MNRYATRPAAGRDNPLWDVVDQRPALLDGPALAPVPVLCNLAYDLAADLTSALNAEPLHQGERLIVLRIRRTGAGQVHGTAYEGADQIGGAAGCADAGDACEALEDAGLQIAYIVDDQHGTPL